MSAFENLTSAINGLTFTVDRLTEEWNKPNPTEAQVQGAAEAVTAQTARINNLLTPPPPSPENPA